jgi:tetraacyldisaccharide 4'-kinase
LKRPWALPLVPLYAAGAGLRSLALRLGLEQVQRLAWPVISVGNLSTGGTGKTPFVIALAQLFQREGVYVDVLSRGYGRKKLESMEVVIEGSAEEYGDEPLLIARETGLPVYVGAQRSQAGWLAEVVAAEAGLERGIHLLDDGFQHRQLGRQIDIVLVNSEDLGDWLLPAGNLREGVAALRRATVLAVPVGDDAAVERLRALHLTQPVWRFRREMTLPEDLKMERAAAFCGIARPAQFFAGLERAGVQIVAWYAFRDHHRFEERDLELLRKLVEDAGATGLITTAKDRVRLGILGAELERAVPLHVAGLCVVFDDEAGMAAWFRNKLKAH